MLGDKNRLNQLVSILTDNAIEHSSGGEVEINAALGAEGDGVDSNGYVRIDGGSVSVNGIRVPDSAIDSEDGIYYMSGTITIDGTVEEHESGDVFRETGNRNGGPGEMGRGEKPEGGRPEGAPGERPKGEFPGGKPGEKPDRLISV